MLNLRLSKSIQAVIVLHMHNNKKFTRLHKTLDRATCGPGVGRSWFILNSEAMSLNSSTGWLKKMRTHILFDKQPIF